MDTEHGPAHITTTVARWLVLQESFFSPLIFQMVGLAHKMHWLGFFLIFFIF